MTQPDPPEVLSYASANVLRPGGSQFVSQQLAGGILLTDSSSKSTPDLNALRLGIVIATLAGLWSLYVAFEDSTNRPHYLIISGILFLLVLVICVVIPMFKRHAIRPTEIRLENDWLNVIAPDIYWLPRRWRVRPSTKFIVMMGAPDLRRASMLAHLFVSRRWGRTVCILRNRPRAECLWIANILQNARIAPLQAEPIEYPSDGPAR